MGSILQVMAQRATAWKITADEASYTCTNCSWKIALSRENREQAAEAFDRHECADHPPLNDADGEVLLEPPDQPKKNYCREAGVLRDSALIRERRVKPACCRE